MKIKGVKMIAGRVLAHLLFKRLVAILAAGFAF